MEFRVPEHIERLCRLLTDYRDFRERIKSTAKAVFPQILAIFQSEFSSSLTRCAEMVSGTDHFGFNSDFLENYQSELQNFYISENLLHFSTKTQ